MTYKSRQGRETENQEHGGKKIRNRKQKIEKEKTAACKHGVQTVPPYTKSGAAEEKPFSSSPGTVPPEMECE